MTQFQIFAGAKKQEKIMKINSALSFLFLLITLSGCSDGVPKVDDPSHPVDASGKPMKGTDFIQKYCEGKIQNETCMKVSKAISIDSGVKKLPRGY